MTRLVIFGDVHANWEALLALQQTERHPDAILCLGDVVGYGPDAKLCLDSIRASATHLIRGSHDAAMNGNYPGASDHDLLAATWAYTRSILSAEDRAYLASLPTALTVEIAGVRFHLIRLAPDDLKTETHMLITMSPDRLRECFDSVEADIILLGGPHIPAMRQLDERLIICPGSLGQPRYGVSDPTFAVWQDGQVQIHHLHYHPQSTIRKLSLLPLDPEYIEQLQSILSSGGLD